MTLRKQDSKSEQVISDFLDLYFYPKHFPKFKRVFDKETQLLGIDTEVVFNDGITRYFDEKSAIHYINKNIPTFAFEIDFRLFDGELVEGWFFDRNKKTDYYLLSWITALKTNNFIVNDVTNLEVLVIRRKKLIDALDKLGITEKKIKAIGSEIRNKNEIGVSYKNPNNPCYFYLTNHLSENPLNLIIKKNFLSLHSELHVNITPH
jgi:hypothetical protein